MGERVCRNCISYNSNYWISDSYGDGGKWVAGYCTDLGVQVSDFSCCNRFYEKATPENSGFHGSYNNPNSSGGGFCYLTSACVEYLGKKDDCEELTTLRNFRDEYMSCTSEGRKLIEEYYSLAPSIVEKIRNSQKCEEYYKYIYEVIALCVKMIKEGKLEETQSAYVKMVKNLKKEFSL